MLFLIYTALARWIRRSGHPQLKYRQMDWKESFNLSCNVKPNY